MNWISALIQTIGAAISAALSRKPATPEPPADLPPGPSFDRIRAAEDARLAADRSSTTPVTREPTPSAVDRAEDAGALRGNGPPSSEGLPTVRKP